MAQSVSKQKNSLHELGYKIFLDRYALKDMTRATLAVGDLVIVVVNAQTGQREIGKVIGLSLPEVTIELLDGEVVHRDVEHVDKPLETDPGQMMDRVAKGIAAVEKSAKLRKQWAERFRWLLEDWKFVPAGRILSAAGTDQLLTYYNCYVIPSPHDSRSGIINTLSEMTEIMSRGGGVGINISSLRPRHAYVKGVNGRSSGSVSWGALYSFVTGLIEQGGCFGPDERILTSVGLIPARELAERIEEGETFYAHTHKGLRRITARFRNGVKPLVEVTTRRGYKVRVTPEHKMAVLRGGHITTIPLHDLREGDEVLLLLGHGVETDYVRLKPVDYESTTVRDYDLLLPEVLDEDLAYQVGCLHRHGYPQADQTARWMIANGLLKANAKKNRVPEALFRSPSSVQTAFLAGYFGGDTEIVSDSRDLLHDLQQLLIINGTVTRIETVAAAQYRLTIADSESGANAQPQRVAISALVERQSARQPIARLTLAEQIDETLRTLPDTITSLKPLGDSEVFDFEVDDVHLLSGAGLYTSNSRRGALMLILDDWHPDVFDFIDSKRTMGQITNANISVNVSDRLMEAIKADTDWELCFPDTSDPKYDTEWHGSLDDWRALGGKVICYRTVKAREVWNAIIESAWASAEPGVWFGERSNKMSNSQYFNPLICTNPCGEQSLGAYSVCNLGAINLSRFYDADRHDVAWNELDTCVRYATRFLDNVIDSTPYFFEDNERVQKGERRVGLNNMGLAELLIRLEMRYGSPESIELIDKLYSFITRAAYDTSVELAQEKGAFPQFNGEQFVQSGFMQSMPEDIRERVRAQGIRNVTLLTQAPTGCVAPDTLVSTKSALRPIVSLGDPNGQQWQILTTEVHTDVGLRASSHFYVNGHQPVKTITTQRGYSLTATHNHRVRIIDQDGDYVWRRMDEMRPGDRVVLKKNTMGDGERVALKQVERASNAKSDLPRRMTPEFAELLGLYMGDGYLKERGGLHIVVSQRDADLLDYVGDLLRRVWGSDRQTPVETRQGAWVINLTGYYIARFFHANDLAKPRGNHGEGAAGAFIPDAVLRAGRACVAAFLRGLFEADGCVTRGNITLNSTSHTLIRQVQTALLGLGVVTTIRTMPEQEDRYGERAIYELRILNRKEAATFVREVGFLSQRKRDQAAHLGASDGRGDTIEVPALCADFYASSQGLPNSARQQIIHRLRNGALNQHFVRGMITEYPALQESRLGQLVGLNVFLDEVAQIEDGHCDTFDLSVPDNHTYIANGFVSHNTTGTMVNTSTGIEPFFSWVYYRKSRLGLHEEQVSLVKDWYASHPDETELPDYFVTAMDLAPEAHVRVQAAIQRWVDSSISKTANLPNNYTVEQTRELYELMYELGCKGGTIYRDGSRDEQVLMLKGDERAESEAKAKESEEPVATPHRVYPRPKKLSGFTINTITPYGTAYITMNSDEHGYPFEVFITAPGKAGSDLQADAEGLGRMISLQLRTTAPQNRMTMLRLVIDQLQGIGGSRSAGFGPNRVLSLPDAVANALLEQYFPQEKIEQLNLFMPDEPADTSVANNGGHEQHEADAPYANGNGNHNHNGAISGAALCPECRTVSLIRAEGCRKCLTCGYSEC